MTEARSLPAPLCPACWRPPAFHGAFAAGRHDQGRHPAFAVGHDGDPRNDAEGRHADAHRGAEQEGRPARQEARGRRRRSGLRLAAVRRKGARADRARTRSPPCSAAGPRSSRKSVLPVFEELNGILFYPVQYEGEESRAQRVLHRRRAEPAGDSGRRLPDERRRRRREALGARRHRLRLSAHHQQDPRSLPQGRRASPPKTS